MCNWCRKKIKRRINKKIFGDADTNWEDLEFAGRHLSSVKDMVLNHTKYQQKKPSKKIYSEKSIKSKIKHSVTTLFKNLKSFSINSSIKKILEKGKPVIEDFMERDLWKGLSKDSHLKLTQSQKALIKKHANEAINTKRESFFRKISQGIIEKKISLTKSKSAILKNMIEDHKKGKNLSAIFEKSNITLTKLDKNKVNTILNEYQAKEEKNQTIFFKNLDKLKKNLVLTKSRLNIFEKMKDDYKNRKFSLSRVPNISKINISDLKKEDLNKMLDYFKEHNIKNSHVSFVKQSKLKQWKSDIRAKTYS